MKTLTGYDIIKGGSSVAGTALLSLLSIFFSPVATAEEIDWRQVEGKVVKAFYPGVASWDFLRSSDHGVGASVVMKRTKACVDCHVGAEGEYDINADGIISGELKKSASKAAFEPHPFSGMPGFKDVEVKAVYDAENIYMRFEWLGSGASVADASLAKEGKADRLSVQVNNTIKPFESFGCFIACHDDQSDMPGNSGEAKKLYGYFTREGETVKPQEALDQYLAKGQFLDLWVVSFEGSEVKSTDEYILADRIEDKNDLSASGAFADGKYAVVITRRLSTGDPTDAVLTDGGVFNIGVAIHDNKAGSRRHYTSFPVSIGLSTPATVTARKR